MTRERVDIIKQTDLNLRDATRWLELHDEGVFPILKYENLVPTSVQEKVKLLAVRLMQEWQQDMIDKLADL